MMLSAPHVAEQLRDGVSKRAEAGTRDLVRDLSAELGCSALHTEPPQAGDPNWDLDSPYLLRILDWQPRLEVVVDFHLMRPRGIDVCLGLGQPPHRDDSLWLPFATNAVAAGMTVGLNWPFAANPRTVTSQLQRRGMSALQIELNYECLGDEEAMRRTFSCLLTSLRALTSHRLNAS